MGVDRDGSRGNLRRLARRPGIEPLEGRALMSVLLVGKGAVGDRAGSITLTLEDRPGRGDPRGPVQVAVDTVAGTAVPGVDYAPVHQVVTVRPGSRGQPVTIPIFPDARNADTRTFAVTLDHAPYPTGAPGPTAAIVSIVHQVTTQAPPAIREAHLLSSGGSVTGFVITFSKDMAAGPAGDLSNYEVLAQQGGSAAVPLLSAVYDAARHAVTLVPAGSVPVGRYVVQNPGPGPRSRLTDAAGDPLDGVGDGLPNGIFYTTFAPHGPTPSPVTRARVAADMRIHALRQKQRAQSLGESLGLGFLPLL